MAVLRIHIGFYSDPDPGPASFSILRPVITSTTGNATSLMFFLVVIQSEKVFDLTNLQLEPVPITLKYMTEHFKIGPFLDAESGSAASMRIQIQGTSHNAYPDPQHWIPVPLINAILISGVYKEVRYLGFIYFLIFFCFKSWFSSLLVCLGFSTERGWSQGGAQVYGDGTYRYPTIPPPPQ